MALEKRENTVTYVSLPERVGKFAIQSSQDNPEAKRRDWKSPDGKTGTKYEIYYKKLSGKLEFAEVYESDYGTQLKVGIRDKGILYIWSSRFDSAFATSVMERLPKVNVGDEMELSPYLIYKGEKTNKGITMHVNGVKVGSYYSQYDTENGEFIERNGLETIKKPDVSKATSADWRIYFAQKAVFLRDKVNEQFMEVNAERKVKWASENVADDNAPLVDEIAFS